MRLIWLDANPEYALELNEGIAPETMRKKKRKAVNAIYLVTWALTRLISALGSMEYCMPLPRNSL
ncbi:MAG: hypothetical protein KIS71_07070 [Bacteroidetes bacterium]|nr:hypothetical protein [Bacteroidota bacterium]